MGMNPLEFRLGTLAVYRRCTTVQRIIGLELLIITGNFIYNTYSCILIHYSLFIHLSTYYQEG